MTVRHSHRTSLSPAQVLEAADRFFATIGLRRTASDARTRGFSGELGVLRLTVTMDGGHATVVEARTDQIGESRLDKNVKKYFVALHRATDARHHIEAGY